MCSGGCSFDSLFLQRGVTMITTAPEAAVRSYDATQWILVSKYVTLLTKVNPRSIRLTGVGIVIGG
jgi:hypothetical protein